MPHPLHLAAPAAMLAMLCSFASLAGDRGQDRDDHHDSRGWQARDTAQVGDRPFYLLDGLDDSRLKDKLQRCENGPFYKSDFSIAHRGAPLQFPEHTKESYEAGARQGAGIVECDVTFTKDGELVCRHAECDLHTTTNIVDTELNAQCSVPWSGQGSSPKCC
ncbi:MAG: glycerophosphodiester phosphodiesterase family protein, partial [Pseudomonadota bacterium]|nr:glycerophosphodiester phosphodiesterase family protein [Pseudomonadota bacterium]